MARSAPVTFQAHTFLLGLTLVASCSGDGNSRDTNPRGDGGTDDSGSSFGCNTTNDPFICEGNRAVPCGVDAGEAQNCDALGKVCNELSGCADCAPGEAACTDGKA